MKLIGENEVKIQIENSTGPMGPAGPRGPRGEQGPRGLTGAAGSKGDKGDAGDPFTYDMFTSEQLAALQGPAGPQGPKGDKGEDGVRIDDATPGATTAYSGEKIEAGLNELNEAKAGCIFDTSARAASHELHAQLGRLGVTLYGKTTETGEGDKSPENPYVISGVDAALIYAGGKNLLPIVQHVDPEQAAMVSINADGTFTLKKNENVSLMANFKLERPLRIVGGLKLVCNNKSGSNIYVSGRTAENVRLFDQLCTKGNVTVCPFDFDEEISSIAIYLLQNSMYDGTVSIMFTYADNTDYEPYKPGTNVIAPPLLPDGSPLMGDGTMDDIIENDVPSGCDKVVRLGVDIGKTPIANGSKCFCTEVISDLPRTDASVIYNVFSNTMPSGTGNMAYAGTTCISITGQRFQFAVSGITDFGSMKTWLENNPTYVYYRSTNYTPDKDIRVTKVTREYYTHEFDGTEDAPPSTIQGYTRYTVVINGKAGVYNKGYCTHFMDTAAVIGANNVNNAISCHSTGYVYIRADAFATKAELQAFFAQQKANGTPVIYKYKLATPEVYMTDCYDLRKPDMLTTDTTTVSGSGETAVKYPHDTKHYIDEKFNALAAALIGG